MNYGSRRSPSRSRALLLYGGWSGHQPEQFADFAISHFLNDFDVVRARDLAMLSSHILAEFDLLLPIWTFGELGKVQEEALFDAVTDGMGIVAWHGAASSFLNSRLHKFILGGQFVGHPGGDNVTYSVNFLDNDPLVSGLKDITFTSEQYYLLVDPAVKVLATTRIDGDDMVWISGVEMPVVWKRLWGRGRVFYCSIGHTLDTLENPSINTLFRRAVRWAVRKSEEEY
jgi:uncharacterized protein